MAGSAILAIKIIADASQAIKELGTTGKATTDFEKGIRGLTAPAAGVAGALGAMTIAAAEDQRQTAALNKIYQNATGTTDDYSAAIEAASKAGEDKAFTDNEVRAALKPLIIATGDATEANALLGPALDIARLAGVSAETAAVALAKAHEGSAAALAGLLPGLDQGASASDAIANATLLAAGAAAEYAASGPGQIASVMNAFTEFGEMIGSTFLPAIAPLAGFLKDVTGYLQQQKDIVGPLAVFFGALAVAILATSVAMGALAIATAPVNLLILGILAIGAGLIMLYQRSEAFRNIVDAVFKVIGDLLGVLGDRFRELGDGVQAVFAWIGQLIEDTIKIIEDIFAGVLDFLRDPFEAFKDIVDGVFAAVQGAITTVIDVIKDVFGFLGVDLNAPFEAMKLVVEQVFDEAERMVDEAIDAIELIFMDVATFLAEPWESLQGVVDSVMDAVIGIVRDAVAVIDGIIKGISDAIAAVEKTASDITPWSVAPPATAGAGSRALVPMARGARTGGAPGGGSTIVNLNVQSADPGEVMRAVRRWSRNNGGSGPFTRGLDRSTA